MAPTHSGIQSNPSGGDALDRSASCILPCWSASLVGGSQYSRGISSGAHGWHAQNPAITGVYAFCGFLGSMLFFGALFQQALERSASRVNLAFRPVCLGFEQFGTSAGDRAFGLVNGNLGRCPDLNPYVARFCGRPLLCRHSIVDRAFHRQFSCATIFPLAASKSWKYQGFGSRTADFHLGRSDQSLEAARKSQKCARQAELGHGRDLEFTTFHRLGLAGAGFFKKGMRGAPPPVRVFFRIIFCAEPPRSSEWYIWRVYAKTSSFSIYI